MPKFFVGKSGCGGAGYIAGHYFAEPREIETEDPAFVDALRKSLVAVEIHEEPVQVATTTQEEVSRTTDLEQGNSAADSELQKPLEELTHRELTDLCKELGLPRARSKTDMVEKIRAYLDSAESKEVSVDEC